MQLMKAIKVITDSEIASSNSEARRLMKQGCLTILFNEGMGEPIPIDENDYDVYVPVPKDKTFIVKKGKNTYKGITYENLYRGRNRSQS
jgi:tyrosyl-tRNA synthetase